MAARVVVFLDDGGVMSDNARRAPQWQCLVGEYFAPILGGTPTAWAEANRVLTARLFDPAAWQARLQAAPDYASFDRRYQLDWLGGMCGLLGIPAPPEAEGRELARRATAYITERVRAAFPAAVPAIRTLHHAGIPLHTASGESSADLAGYLTGMGVRECFGHLYGPDLINTLKNGPAYYTRIFAAAGVAPADALVVDDNPQAAAWAQAAGARVVLVCPGPHLEAGPAWVIPTLAELPGIIERLLPDGAGPGR
ncbi:MAG TPA: HAD family hydrolase [Chloroflexia bacterium]|nr:HAD family hydrolase [Chloroflexia bacterium]